MTETNVNQIINSINKTCQSKGEKYSQYSCQTVSWDDVQRGTVGGELSSWGGNITDTQGRHWVFGLWYKKPFPAVRTSFALRAPTAHCV